MPDRHCCYLPGSLLPVSTGYGALRPILDLKGHDIEDSAGAPGADLLGQIDAPHGVFEIIVMDVVAESDYFLGR